MKRSVLFPLFLLVLLAANAQTTTETSDPKWVIRQCVGKMGGEAYLRSISTLYTEMSTEMDGRKVLWVTKEKLPNLGAFQIVYNGNIMYEDWFNGKKGYEQGRGQVIESDPASLVDKLPRKNIFNELDYLDSSLYTLEMLPGEKLDGTPCYRISAVFVTGMKRIIFVETKTFNIIREDRIGKDNSASSSYFSGFRKFGKLLFYSVFRMGEGKNAQTGVITKLLVNEGISDQDFNK